MMMATATSPHSSLHFSRSSMGYYCSAQEDLGPTVTSSKVCPLTESCEDDLSALKQFMISPHKVRGHCVEQLPSVHQLNTVTMSPHSCSPSPLPEPDFDRLSTNISHYSTMENLQECCEDTQDSYSSTSNVLQPSQSIDIVYGGSSRGRAGQLRTGAVFSDDLNGGMSPHKPVARQHQSLAAVRREPVSTSLPLQEREVLLCPDQEPVLLGNTRPVPPPRKGSTSHAKPLQSTVSSPAILNSEPARNRSISFLQCKAGDDLGTFQADYLGNKEIDSYNHTVNSVAKQLVDSKPVEVITYVTSEKIRLAPPKNAALLFKSFAVRDILAVEMCTKNKRIVGILVWKRVGVPVCHILRCPTSLVSTELYESLLQQTQQVDDVQSQLESVSEAQQSDPPSPTDLLHKLPAVYIGSTGAGKLHSISEVIAKVLSECQPSKSQEVGVWLSLSQLQLVLEQEPFMTNDTSRIRAIGVSCTDKRYMGYIIKEEGKPLTGHVLRCTSAALMVSLVSFLRQSCQLTVFQRGGSFYDELSADDEDFNTSTEGVCDQPSLVKRIRSLTLSSRHTISTRPSFQSHTILRKQLSPSDLSPRKINAVQNPHLVSPQNITSEDYARFTVTYVGSASLYLPFTPDSVEDALDLFEQDGVSAGKAAVPKNQIEMQISALSVVLTDKSHKLFVTRNYSRKAIQGFCVCPSNEKYFSIATSRPGFPNNVKVHVFAHGGEASQHIVASLDYWLELEPTK